MPSDRVRMWMTSVAGGRMVAMGPLNGIDLDMTVGPDPGRGWRDIWTAMVAFGPIVFQVFASAAPELLDGFKPNTVNTHILWRYRGRFRWVPRPGLSEQQLNAVGSAPVSGQRRDRVVAGGIARRGELASHSVVCDGPVLRRRTLPSSPQDSFGRRAPGP